MKKLATFFIAILLISSAAYAATGWWMAGEDLGSILGYSKLGSLFTMLQNKYFSSVYLGILVGVPLVFLIHYLILGPKVFSHDGKKVYVFNIFNRVVHFIAAISFLVLVPTGFILIFGSKFGGGDFVRLCKDLHTLSTVVFAISVLPMFLMWVKDMFLHYDDFIWLMIVGGYLSKVKKPVPAGKFNAGQKTWFWLCTLGGILMIATGAAMFFLDFGNIEYLKIPGVFHIDILRGSAIVHNVLGVAIVALFFVHIYMSMFAIKGAINSMITGYKEEEEIEILHSRFYKKLKEEGKL